MCALLDGLLDANEIMDFMDHNGVESAYMTHLVKKEYFSPISVADLMEKEFAGCSMGTREQIENKNPEAVNLDMTLSDGIKPKTTWYTKKPPPPFPPAQAPSRDKSYAYFPPKQVNDVRKHKTKQKTLTQTRTPVCVCVCFSRTEKGECKASFAGPHVSWVRRLLSERQNGFCTAVTTIVGETVCAFHRQS